MSPADVGVRLRHPRDVLGRAFLVCAAVRGVTAVHAILVNLLVVLPLARSGVGVALACLLIAGWSVLVSALLLRPARRRRWVFALDLLVTAAVVLATPLVVDGAAAPLTLAAYWGGGSAIYAAVLLSTRWGLLQALLICVACLVLPPFITLPRIDLVVLIVGSTLCLGLLTSQFKVAMEEQERVRVRSAALSERERLARIVHDGALQVLALVEREAPTLGPRGMRLAALARESESQLRTLLRDREVGEDAQTPLVDLAAALDKYQSASVTVSTMAGEVMIPRSVADEVEATLSEVLANVDEHAGSEASTWVLLDQESDDEVILWVRDNGVGMNAEAVTDASERGRFGIRDSIVGRMSALQGSALLKSTPGLGTEWELRFPVDMGE